MVRFQELRTIVRDGEHMFKGVLEENVKVSDR